MDFVDETGDAFEEYIVSHHKFVTWMQANGYSASKKYTQEEVEELQLLSLLIIKATSMMSIGYKKSVCKDAFRNGWTILISVTINLPNDVSEELVTLCMLRHGDADVKDVLFIEMVLVPVS